MKCLHFLNEVEFWHLCNNDNGKRDDDMAVISQIFVTKLKLKKKKSQEFVAVTVNKRCKNERMLHPLLCN